eukprot:Hpha_TRINITY_DN16533_c1_g10::TRINITY_DN16533_c1_g10_i1::g.132502::m.132502
MQSTPASHSTPVERFHILSHPSPSGNPSRAEVAAGVAAAAATAGPWVGAATLELWAGGAVRLGGGRALLPRGPAWPAALRLRNAFLSPRRGAILRGRTILPASLRMPPSLRLIVPARGTADKEQHYQHSHHPYQTPS